MDLLRSLVSGDRKRTVADGVNLDLSYITQRLIAMSFPASGTESLYRNPIADVAAFLDKRHRDSYMVFNLSERPYSTATFHERVVELGFPDHMAPPVEVAWTLCLTMHAWLQAAPEHVAVVHCLAGKGRTGVLIAAYMLFSGQLWVREEPQKGTAGPLYFTLPPPRALTAAALAAFIGARGEGIKNASQARVVNYFARVVHAAIIAESARMEANDEGAEEVGGAGATGATGSVAVEGGAPAAAPAPLCTVAPEQSSGEGSRSGDHSARRAPAPLPMLESIDLSVSARGGAAVDKSVRVRWDAALRVRSLRSLPLPLSVAVRLQRVIVAGLPPIALLPGSPVLVITTAPYQGVRTRLLYDSSAAAAAAASAVGEAGGRPRDSTSVTSGESATVVFDTSVVLAGDVLVRVLTAAGASLMHMLLHSAFLPEGVLRLARNDVDRNSATKSAFPLAQDFRLDLIYALAGRNVGEAAATPNAGDEASAAAASPSSTPRPAGSPSPTGSGGGDSGGT